MSVVELRVELPSYSHSFVIQVPVSYTILEVKGEIFRACVGAPRADGQRIIWRGRLLRDEEKVEDIWKTAEDSRIIHLAVNPAAWSSGPPELPSSASTASAALPSYFSTPQPGQLMQPSAYPPRINNQPVGLGGVQHHPMGYVVWKHQNAILALTSGRVLVNRTGDQTTFDLNTSRPWAIQVLEKNGYSWPGILDEPFPGVDDDGVALESLPEGVKYQLCATDDQNFLSLQNPGATPNIFQTHALKVLTHTFPLLSLPIPQTTTTTSSTTMHHTIPREVNQLLQQLGLPPLRMQNAAQNHGNAFLREINLRPLLGPLIMLVIRTLLLVYFVSPARKPVFGIVVGAWILYEAWGPIRAAIFGAGDRQAPPGVNVGLPPRPQQDGAPARQAGQIRIVIDVEAVIDNLSKLNIPAEEEALAASERATPAEEPGLAHKVTTFLCLLVLTLHPAVWNRRRGVLRQREGRVRTEANAREREPEAPGTEVNVGEDSTTTEAERTERESVARKRVELVAQHARRPRWVQAYIDRVRRGEWVDD
ncbi:hypothetical protein PILCRDRAFT_157734 [Piloderma croceum F 1598]|uniref:Ubiquitin-like domain-containing protein n=1 Tax=Piloderma croceum (strain F 1598) TaxID=765440 RepID=A0A0C3BWQ6_PILCF|nr:hypothetical protein PILCRDRAFT_157734 [Piloderma croceum F 1598]